MSKFGLGRAICVLAASLFVSQGVSAGEILMSGTAKNAKKTAASARDAAENLEDPSEVGVLAPRGGSPADDRAYEAKVKEKMRQDAEAAMKDRPPPARPQTQVIVVPSPYSAPPAAPADAKPATTKAGSLRSNARVFRND